MAKKGKRSQPKAKPSRKPIKPATQPEESRSEPLATGVPIAKAPAPAKVDLAQEYRYVLTDLRKIGIIAIAMFVLLFLLAFIVR